MDRLQIKYPIYIISKGRWETPLSARMFLKEKIPFTIAVEPQEYELYKKTIPVENIAVLPFSNLGLGSYPARNWCWEDSIAKGFKNHFLFDDNIRQFYRLNNGKRKQCDALTPLLTLQEFHDRYSNLAISGYNYLFFATKETKVPFSINTHVYSGMLIRNDIPYRWRLKYNEDVDLCLQALHNKWATVLVNAFLIDKVSTTVKMKGGNQTELYDGNSEAKTLLKSKSLEKAWPQYVSVVRRFKRFHHHVSWAKHFKHPLKRRSSKEAILNGETT